MIDSASAAAGAAPDLKQARRRKLPTHDSARVDRLPPHAIEAEQGVLGCAMLAPNDGLPRCIQKLKTGADRFYDLRHQTIYGELVVMFDARIPIDIITLQQRLKDKGLLDQIGGIPYLNALQDSVPSAANLDYYLDLVEEKWMLRTLIHACTDVVGRVYEYEGEVDALLDEVERDILRIAEARAGEAIEPTKTLVQRAISQVETYFDRQGQLGGTATGFSDLDRMTDGLHGGEMIVIAARPSMGKSSLAMNIAEHVALNLKLPVGVFSLEMTAESLVLRTLCSQARVNLRNIREGFMAESDFPRLTHAAGKLSAAPLHIDDTPGLSILQLRTRARRMWQQHGVKLLIVDYLQLLNSSSKRAQENRQQEIAEISAGIKALAKELNVPVIVLAQLNRELEKDKTRKPRLSDLRESGAIEQDADLVGLLYKAAKEDDEVDTAAETKQGVAINLLVAKQRNGPTGDVHLTFLKSYTRFESAAKVTEEDVPV